MLKRMMFLALFMALAVSLVMPAAPVAAKGAERIPYEGQENFGYCFDPATIDSRCSLWSPGETKVLPNGKTITHGMVMVIQFVSDQPLFEGVVIATVNVSAGTGDNYEVVGTWRLELNAVDGYWEGPVCIHMSDGNTNSVYSGKGYGALEGMIVHGTNENGYLSGQIIKLP